MSINNQFKINVEVAFATLSKQLVIPVSIDCDGDVYQAIKLSGIANEFPEYDFSNEALQNIGVFGKKIDGATYKLRDHDRIEIYRILSKTPNQKRLERAKKHD